MSQKKIKRKPKVVEPVKLIIEQSDFDEFLKHGRLSASNVDELTCNHRFQKIPAKLRGKFMDELWRILKPGAKAVLQVPYWSSLRATCDYETEWPPISEASFLYFNKEWREKNGATHQLRCDFDFQYGYVLDPETATKSAEVQAFWVKHYLNAVLDLQVVLTKRG